MTQGNIMLKSTYGLLQKKLQELNEELLELSKDTENHPGLLTKNNEIRGLLVNPKFIEDLELDHKTVSIGCRVRFKKDVTGEECEYNILGSADVLNNPACYGDDCASVLSPIITPLLGKHVGDIVWFQDQHLTVLSILPLSIPDVNSQTVM